MALRRRFLAETELHLQNKGFLRPRRWLCAQPSPPPPKPPSPSSKKVSKKSQAAKEKKTQAVESFVKSYMLTHPGVFPKVTEVQQEVGGSWYILKEILTETKSKVLLVSQDDKQIGKMDPHVTTESSEATEIKESADYCKLDRQEEGFIVLTEKLDVVVPQIPAKKDMAVLAGANISDNAEIVEGKEIEHSTEDLTSSAAGLDKQLPYIDGELHMEEETSGVLRTDICSSETNLCQVAPSINGDCTPEINCSASDHNTLETAVNSQESNHSALEIPFNGHLPNQKSSDIESKASGEVISLIDFIKRRAEEKVLTCAEVSNSRHEVDSDFKEDKNHVKNLVDIFKKNQSSGTESNLIHESSIKQERCITPNEECEDDFKTRMKGLFSRIIGLSNEKVKTGSQISVPSNNTNRLNSELKGSVPENLNIASWIEDHTSSNHLDKTEVIKQNVETKRLASKEINLNSFDDRGHEPSTRGTGNVNLQLEKNEKKMDSTDISYSDVMSEDDSDVAAFDYMKPASTDEVPLSAKGLNLNSSAQETGSDRNRLLVKFLRKTAKANDIGLCFGDCGPISEIHIVPSRRENRYSYAYVYFKTEEGLRKALSKDDVAVCGADVVVEPASSIVHSRLFNMDSLNDTEFPLDFLKNPTRTVVVKGLPDNLPFHQLRQILSSWGHISGFAMGSSSSSVYVEFESEESKERILAEASISVSERKLPVLRVDAPKTTVVRIANVNPLSGVAKIRSICDSYGQVKRIVSRDRDTFDVHFKLSEWINMVKILNRLNGLLVDQNQWVAQPATVIPAEVLQAFWNRPGGHKQVHGQMRDLCRRIQESSIDTTSLLGLTREYYGDI